MRETDEFVKRPLHQNPRGDDWRQCQVRTAVVADLNGKIPEQIYKEHVFVDVPQITCIQANTNKEI